MLTSLRWSMPVLLVLTACEAGQGAPDAAPPDPIDAGAGDSAEAADAGGADAGAPARLPPWLSYCDTPSCASVAPLELRVCPQGDPQCLPRRSTTIVPRVDGRPISAVAFPLGMPEGAVLQQVSGNGSVIAHLVTSYAPTVVLSSDLELTISYYDLAPVWGGTVFLDFVSASRTAALLDSVFYRHRSYDTGSAAADLHGRGQVAILDERNVSGISSEHINAFFMPSELAGVMGEGNFSYGDGTVTSNYGNPPYIEALGGIMNTAFPRFAHECAHELFDEVSASFAGNSTCLNEGIADALAFVVGHLPVQDFGPVGVRGIDFDAGCTTVSEIHDVGNCYFWHVKKANLLTASFMRGVFHPQHRFDFDSCSQNVERTGNTILVYFTEAAGGADMIPVLDSMGLPHAASYAQAKAALGL